MDWFYIAQLVYLVILVIVCLRILYDTRNNTKTLAYLLFAIFIPVLGILFYFTFGINYRKRKIYSKKISENEELAKKVKDDIARYTEKNLYKGDSTVQGNRELAYMLLKDSSSPLTSKNNVKLLLNGENKFPEVIKALNEAKDHIHIEYYIFDDDETGRAIEEVLIRKAREGVKVRLIFDDFGSRSLSRNMVPRLKEAGVEALPFYRIYFIALANRINYRNHRKIIVIDGHTSFVGGINISNRYVNDSRFENPVFWRDTHLKIEGPGTFYLQYLFMCDWNFCCSDKLTPNDKYFPRPGNFDIAGDKVVQIAASGPDSDSPTILYSYLQAINLANKEILITTPYFIPGDSLLDAISIASLGGITVKLLVPGKSDSMVVDMAARSYYDDLLRAGVEIYFYRKGFVHAKTLVADGEVAIVGTANLDNRSFDLNFEVNAIVYDKETAAELRDAFYRDIEDSEKVDKDRWFNRPLSRQLSEKAARLFSPLL